MGEKGYSLTTMNCQHFVSECRNGTSLSPEVQNVVTGGLVTAAVASTVGFVALVGQKIISNSKKKQKFTD